MSILSDRLHRQLISHHPHDRVEQVVQHMLCIQSQDITQSRRAIASRMPQPDCIDQITQAYQQGLIVRTWTQRGTIHAICSSDVKWMLDLCASQTLSGFARRRQSLSMSDQVCQEMTDCII